MPERDSKGTSRASIPASGLAALRGYLAGVGAFERPVKLMLAVTAMRGVVIASLSTVLNSYLYSLGYDARFIGLINAANAAAVLIVSLPLGYLADRFGRRPVMLAGAAGYPLSVLGLALSHSTFSIIFFNFLFGAFSSSYWVAVIPTLYANTTERNRVHAFSLNSFLLWGFGPIGALLSSQVVEQAARQLHVHASSSTALRYGMLFMVVMGAMGSIPYPFIKDGHTGVGARAEIAPMRNLAGLFIRLLAPDLVLAFAVGSVLTFTQLYFRIRFGLDPGPIGLIMAMGGALAGVGTLLAPIASRRWGNLTAAVRFQWMVVPPMACLALSPALGLSIPAYWLLLTLRGTNDPVYTAFIQDRVPEAYRSRISGLYSVTYSIGFSLGPAASGVLQQASGFTLAFLFGTVCYFAGTSMLYLFFARGTGSALPAGTG